MAVLCYVRPWNERQFKLIAEHAFPNESIHYVSDFPKHRPYFLQEKLVRQFRQEKEGVSLISTNDIIIRCRLLRNIDSSVAIRLVNSCYKVISDVFDLIKPRYVIGLTVDSYVIDIIQHVAKERGVKYIGLVPLFINGYSRISTRGELNRIREPSDQEIEDVYQRLNVYEEKPDFLNLLESAEQLKALWRKNKTKRYLRLIYMTMMRLRSPSYWYCYHYWSSYLMMRFSVEKVSHKIFDELKIYNGKTCYIPLQYFPECTIDYWVERSEKIDYYQVLLDIVNCLSKEQIQVYIKEHPNCLSIRPKGFYEKLKSIPNVHLISPAVSSSVVINNTDFTLVWTGSAGMEAALLGKPVVHLGNPYYIIDVPGFTSWDKFIDDHLDIPTIFSEQDRKAILKHVLGGSIQSKFSPDPRPLSKEEGDKMARSIGEKIRGHLVD